MTPFVDPSKVERFRALVARAMGLWFDDARLGFLAEVLHRRLDRARIGVDAYLTRLEHPDDGGAERRDLARELTVTETYFFRNGDQLRAFTDVALKTRALSPSPLRILCAGCASGEEPYSLAMLAREHLPETGLASTSIRAVDINADMLEKAARGRYSTWALRETPPEARARWFSPGRDFELHPSVRAMVKFEERNLVEERLGLFHPDAFDVVFCRNVLMYFGVETAQAVVARITRSLTPGGYLFLGHAETLRGLSQDYHLVHTHGTFYYRLRSSSEEPYEGPRNDLSAATASTSRVHSHAPPGSWVDAIRSSADRVRSLTEASNPAPAPGRFASESRDFAHAVDLIHRERFTEARAMLNDLPSDAARDPDVLLLRAVLLTHGGDLAQAERVCTELLELDETSAGARYLMALCRESAGDQDGARHQDQAATYLDPTFAMPRLHLGLIARREGDSRAARKELERALSLLAREDTSRILLFGGGFTREALVKLCKAELSSCGGGS
jgi:chemotaxis protein methyltransferase CheR